jgi:hypothetical protein
MNGAYVQDRSAISANLEKRIGRLAFWSFSTKSPESGFGPLRRESSGNCPEPTFGPVQGTVVRFFSRRG